MQVRIYSISFPPLSSCLLQPLSIMTATNIKTSSPLFSPQREIVRFAYRQSQEPKENENRRIRLLPPIVCVQYGQPGTIHRSPRRRRRRTITLSSVYLDIPRTTMITLTGLPSPSLCIYCTHQPLTHISPTVGNSRNHERH